MSETETQQQQAVTRSNGLAEWQNQILTITSKTLTDLTKLDNSEREILKTVTESPVIAKLPSGIIDHDLPNKLIAASVLSGIKDKPDGATSLAILEIVKSKYGNLTIQEIILAFRMHAAGQLPQRINHFNLMDLTFFTSVVDLYCDSRRKAIQRAKQIEPPAPEPKPMTGKEGYENLLQKQKSGEPLPEFYPYDAIYNHMEQELIFSYTDPRKKEIHNQVKAEFSKQDELEALATDSAGRRRLQETFADRVKTECRKRFVQLIIRGDKPSEGSESKKIRQRTRTA